MLIIPAIDIMDGRVVRLWQGDFKKERFYSDDPAGVALEWESQGAGYLHIVDLDGARTGEIKNLKSIERIIKKIKIPVEVGGGIREVEDAALLFDKGADRVVLGTRAFEDEEFLKKVLQRFNDKIAVSIDFAGNSVMKMGWQERLQLTPEEFAKRMQRSGVPTLIFTDIALDGTLSGPRIDRLRKLLRIIDISAIASGGICSLEDIKELKALEKDGLIGVIIGRALYEGKIKLREAIDIAEPRGT